MSLKRFNPCVTEACAKRCDNFGVYCEKICIDEIERLRMHVAECEAVLRQLANPGWVSDTLASGSVERIAGDICALKRQARGVLNSPPNT